MLLLLGCVTLLKCASAPIELALVDVFCSSKRPFPTLFIYPESLARLLKGTGVSLCFEAIWAKEERDVFLA